MNIDSTTDTPEQVLAAIGNAQPEPVTPVVAEPVISAPPGEVPPEPVTPVVAEPVDDTTVGDVDTHKGGGFQRRIDKLTRKNYELKREMDALRSALQTSVEPVIKPDPDTFQTNAEYIDAMTEYQVDQALSARQTKTNDILQRTDVATKMEVFNASVADAKAGLHDYDTVVSSVNDIPVTEFVKSLIIGSNVGGKLIYALAKDRAELLRINSLEPIDAIEAIVRIKDKLAIDVPTVVPTTKAPTPIVPVQRVVSAMVGDPDPSNMSFKDYVAWRNKNKLK